MITCALCMSQLYIYVAMVTIGCVDACLLSLQLEQLCSSMVSHTCTCIYVRTSPCGPSGGGGGGGGEISSFGPLCTTYRYEGLAIKLYDIAVMIVLPPK